MNIKYFSLHKIIFQWLFSILNLNHIDYVMVGMLTSSVVDCEFEPWSGLTKDYKIGICMHH
jgi:hypothetical protein